MIANVKFIELILKEKNEEIRVPLREKDNLRDYFENWEIWELFVWIAQYEKGEEVEEWVYEAIGSYKRSE